MQKSSIASMVLASIVLSACSEVGSLKDLFQDSPKVTCSSPEAQANIAQILTEQTQRAVILLGAQDGLEAFKEADVKATVAKLGITVTDVRTIKQDEKSTQIACEAQVNIQTPAQVWQQAQASFQTIHDGALIESALNDYGLVKEGENLTKTIEYSVQPTDDQQKIYTKLENATAIVDGLATVVSSHLLKAKIDEHVSQMKLEEETLNQEILLQMQQRLTEAQESNQLAKQALNALWSQLPAQVQSNLTADQSAWVKRRDSECAYEASSSASDALEQQTLQTLCVTANTHDRIRELEQHAAAATSQLSNEAQQTLTTLKNRMNQAWNQLPAEVKSTLETDQIAWQNQTRQQCGQAQTSLAQSQCHISAYEQRLNTLADYSIH